MWISWLFVVPVFAEIHRYDIESVFDQTLRAVPAQLSGRPGAKLTSGSTGQFVTTFACSDSTTLCNRVKTTVDRVLANIAAVVQLNTNIKVYFKFYNFCGTQTSCSLKDVVGLATAGSYFPGRFSDTEPYLLYPQGLIKQLSLNSNVAYADFDILADFNSMASYYYNDGDTMSSSKIDLEFVVSHEVTHGLGFASGWFRWSDFYSISTLKDSAFLTPQFVTNKTNNQIVGFSFLFAMDKNIALTLDSTDKLVNRAKSIYEYPSQSMSQADFATIFQASGTPFSTAKDIFNLVNRNPRSLSLTFSNASVPSLKLYSSISYSSGSSIGHVDADTYNYTPEFLMVPTIAPYFGQTFESIVKNATKNGTLPMYGPYGPGLLQALTDMGWPTIFNPAVKSMQIATTFKANLDGIATTVTTTTTTAMTITTGANGVTSSGSTTTSVVISTGTSSSTTTRSNSSAQIHSWFTPLFGILAIVMPFLLLL